MEPFARLDAAAAPIGVPNVDTDQIVPARFLWRKRHDGWGHLLFHDLRFNDAGVPKPEFVLNRDAYRDARIVVADLNFGCGSSREHAVWALYDYGIRAVLAPSFGTYSSTTVSKTACCRWCCRPSGLRRYEPCWSNRPEAMSASILKRRK